MCLVSLPICRVPSFFTQVQHFLQTRSRKVLIYNDYAIRIGSICHYILICEEWPGATVPLWFSLSSDAPLRRVRRPRCLADRGGRRVRTDVTSHLNARPASRGHGCGCSLPATEFVAQRCPLVVDPMCRNRVRMTLTPYSASTAMNRWPSIRLLSWCQIGRNPSSDYQYAPTQRAIGDIVDATQVAEHLG